jgi:hypothetical protein
LGGQFLPARNGKGYRLLYIGREIFPTHFFGQNIHFYPKPGVNLAPTVKVEVKVKAENISFSGFQPQPNP